MKTSRRKGYKHLFAILYNNRTFAPTNYQDKKSDEILKELRCLLQKKET